MQDRRRQWHPTPVLLPGKSHGQRSLVGCCPWGRWESDTTERLHFLFSPSCTGEGNGNPLQCSWGESQGRGSLVGCHLWGHTESDTTKATYQQQQQLFTSSGQSIGASASVLSMNIQGWFPLGLTGLISLLSKGLSRVFSNTTVQKHQFFSTQPSLWSNFHIHTWLLEKP